MRVLIRLIDGIDDLNKWIGDKAKWLTYPLAVILFYEVISRRIFNAPNTWAYDAVYILFGIMFMMGAGYTLLVNKHIRVDFLYSAISQRGRALVDMVWLLVLFFPVIGALLYFGIYFTKDAWVALERAQESAFAPPIYPFKTILPIAIFLLLIQGVADFIRSLLFILTRRKLGS